MPLLDTQSFRTKLILLVVFACIITAGIIGTSLIVRGYHTSKEQTFNQLLTSSRIIAFHSEAALDFNDPEAARETLSALRAIEHFSHSALYRADGTVLAEYPTPGPDQTGTGPPRPATFIPTSQTEPLHDDGRWVQVIMPVIKEGRPQGTVYVVYDRHWVVARLRQNLVITLALTLAATTVAMLIALHLQRLLTRPLAALSVTARTISNTGDYSVRAAKYGNDELGQLTDLFNEMLDQIQGQTRQIRAANDRFRIAVESAPNGMIMVDHAGSIVMVNREAETLLGYTQEELSGQPVEMLVPERFRSRHPAQRGGFFANPQSRPMGAGRELFALRKDGAEVPVEIALSPIETDQGLHVLAAIVDITERLRAEAAVRENEQRLRTLTNAMPAFVWTSDVNGEATSFNDQWFEYTGLTKEDSRDIHHSRVIHPDDSARTLNDWERAREVGEPYESELRIRRRDGQYRWFLARAVPVRDHAGEVTGWIGSTIDIHDRKQAEQDRDDLLESERAARTEAERASRMKDEFLATLSHELRTPLTAIMGWAQMLRRGTMKEDDSQQGLEIIERNARVQTQIIEDLLDMSRIISGKIRLDVQNVDLEEVVGAALATVQPAAQAKGIRIQQVIDPRVGPVRGDAARLQQVVWNLLSNAIKFTQRGGRVQVAVQRINSHIEINVSDTGEGIPAAFLPYVFERFRQADASTTRRHGGLGLGLAIVKQLVEVHGGRVRATSPGQGEGSTFTVELPLSIVHDADVGEQRVHPRVPGSRADANGRVHSEGLSLENVRVLVVEDEPDARELIARLLEGKQAQVLRAGSSREALDSIGTFNPHVIVSDIGMPLEDGYQFIHKVRSRSQQEGGSIPAIALTAFARSEDRTRALVAGYQMHVAKPVEPGELIASVASLAGRVSSSQ